MCVWCVCVCVCVCGVCVCVCVCLCVRALGVFSSTVNRGEERKGKLATGREPSVMDKA